MSEIQGVQMGLPNHPTIRRVTKPKPFQRPSTSITAAEVAREWRTVAAREIAVGDTVPGIGTISDLKVVGHHVVVAGGLGNTATWRTEEPVFAFTAVTA